MNELNNNPYVETAEKIRKTFLEFTDDLERRCKLKETAIKVAEMDLMLLEMEAKTGSGWGF